jgi:hypothetical protein
MDAGDEQGNSPTQAEIDAGEDVMAEIVDDLIEDALAEDEQG